MNGKYDVCIARKDITFADLSNPSTDWNCEGILIIENITSELQYGHTLAPLLDHLSRCSSSHGTYRNDSVMRSTTFKKTHLAANDET